MCGHSSRSTVVTPKGTCEHIWATGDRLHWDGSLAHGPRIDWWTNVQFVKNMLKLAVYLWRAASVISNDQSLLMTLKLSKPTSTSIEWRKTDTNWPPCKKYTLEEVFWCRSLQALAECHLFWEKQCYFDQKRSWCWLIVIDGTTARKHIGKVSYEPTRLQACAYSATPNIPSKTPTTKLQSCKTKGQPLEAKDARPSDTK